MWGDDEHKESDFFSVRLAKFVVPLLPFSRVRTLRRGILPLNADSTPTANCQAWPSASYSYFPAQNSYFPSYAAEDCSMARFCKMESPAGIWPAGLCEVFRIEWGSVTLQTSCRS